MIPKNVQKAGKVPGQLSLPVAIGGILALAAALMLLAPAVLTSFQLGQMGRFICYAIVAVGIGLAWGRGGMLTMGQGAFFGLGAYMMAMNMKLGDAALAGTAVPDFMQFSAKPLPSFWVPFSSLPFTLIMIVLAPVVLAGAMGFLIFKRRVKGSYFAILNQALVAALVVLLVGQQDTLGGSNGLSGFQSFMGLSLLDPLNKYSIYLLAAGTLIVMLAGAYWLMRSRFGELLVATRDAEERVRFLGYDPATVKTVAYILAAIAASLAGALFVPIVGIISPAEIGVVPSISFVVGVAIGGRTSLFGPVLGALAVAWGESYFAQTFPSQWSYLQGAMLVIVILILPGGVASLVNIRRRRARKSGKDSHQEEAKSAGESSTESAPADSVGRHSTIGAS
ncbi:urea ABC transporter permease subunit UrtC [Corynebacteriaceae bacterium 6-324]